MKYFGVLLLSLCIKACKQVPDTGHTSIDTGLQQSPLITQTNPSDSLHSMDTSVMVVDSMSHIIFNGAPMKGKENNVYNGVYNGWLQAYQKTNHLPLAFKLVQQGTVLIGIRDDIGEAVVKAQHDLKDYIAKDKFKKKFAELSTNEKDSMQRMHPILFQKPF